MGSGILKVIVAPENRADLHFEIGVVLGQGPNRKDQMMGIDGANFARSGPAFYHLCLGIDQSFEISSKNTLQTGAPCSISLANSLLSRG